LHKLCIQPLKEVAGTDILHTIVSSKGVLLFWYPILTYHYSEERIREHHKTTDRCDNHERRKICCLGSGINNDDSPASRHRS
jgi:hypothetical protein